METLTEFAVAFAGGYIVGCVVLWLAARWWP